MAFDKDKIYDQALEAIGNNKLYFIEDVVAYIPCGKDTFYRFFPIDSDEYDNIKEALDTNRINTKVRMRKKWEESDAPALQMGLMKLISTDEEAHRLNGSSRVVDNTSSDGSMSVLKISPEAAKAISNKFDEEV